MRRVHEIATVALAAFSSTCILDLDGLSSGGAGGGGSRDAGADGGCPVLDCSCVNGPTELAKGPMFAKAPRGIAVDADGLYWVNQQGGNVVRLPANGGGPEPLAQATSPGSIAVFGDTLVWTAESGVFTCSLPACADARMLTAASTPLGLRAVAFDGTTVAFTEHTATAGEGKARSCSIENCNPLSLGEGLNTPEGISLYGGMVYWADRGNGNANGTVWRSPKDTQSAAQISASLQLPTSVAADDVYVYWTEGLPNGHVYRCDLTAIPCDTPTDIAPAGGPLARPGDVVLTADRIYWTSLDDGSISSCPKPGCGTTKPVVHVAGRTQIGRLAVGDGCLFWTEDEGGGAVMKAPR